MCQSEGSAVRVRVATFIRAKMMANGWVQACKALQVCSTVAHAPNSSRATNNSRGGSQDLALRDKNCCNMGPNLVPCRRQSQVTHWRTRENTGKEQSSLCLYFYMGSGLRGVFVVKWYLHFLEEGGCKFYIECISLRRVNVSGLSQGGVTTRFLCT